MRVNKDTIKELVREVMSDMDESDLIVRRGDGKKWEELSAELKIEVDELIDNISNDNYSKALENISGIGATMKIWKHRIVMGGVKRGAEDYDMQRFNLSEKAKK